MTAMTSPSMRFIQFGLLFLIIIPQCIAGETPMTVNGMGNVQWLSALTSDPDIRKDWMGLLHLIPAAGEPSVHMVRRADHADQVVLVHRAVDDTVKRPVYTKRRRLPSVKPGEPWIMWNLGGRQR